MELGLAAELGPPSESAHYLRELAKAAALATFSEAVKLFKDLVNRQGEWWAGNSGLAISNTERLKNCTIHASRQGGEV